MVASRASWFKSKSLPSTAQARARVMNLLKAHREMDLGVLSVKSEMTLRRAAAIVEGLEREGVVMRRVPEPGVSIVRMVRGE